MTNAILPNAVLNITRLDQHQADFDAKLDELLNRRDAAQGTVEQVVAEIVGRVRADGDAALLDYTQRFDRLQLTQATLAFTNEEIEAACQEVGPLLLADLAHAARRITEYHQWQMPVMGISHFQDEHGALLGQLTTPVGKAGLYVPGGLAAYPSSVLMNAIPARVAGVAQLYMVVPTPDGHINPMVLAAARIAGVDQIFKVGGAQAVAALAFGTATIPAVDKIVGPGNIYVATAKRQVFGQVGIDMIAGPSEITVIADSENDPNWIAADLLSQAEHDETAQSILITDTPYMAEAVINAMVAHLGRLERRAICEKALEARGAIIVTRNLEEAAAIASRIAPEHLELAVEDPWTFLPMIRNAGAIFMGRYTPEAMGDYMAGPNHVLPTAGTARFSSPLGVHDFIKRTSLIGCNKESMRALGPAVSRLAKGEGLTAHQLSVDLRLEYLR